VPEFDSRALFEKLILDGFQAGLSWITILRKRDAFRTAFANFDPEKIARFDAKEIAALMDNPGIIRNRAKIEGTVVSARVWLEIQAREGFSDFLWKFFDGRPQQNGFHSRDQIPVQSEKSMALSKGLKERGFKFCGRTIVYAFCQATGMVNDHLVHAGDMMPAPPWRARRRLPDQVSRRQPRCQRRIQREHPNRIGRRTRYQDLSQPAVDYNVPLAAT
jgi:DNA-3-methyladenine glycosylase I